MPSRAGFLASAIAALAGIACGQGNEGAPPNDASVPDGDGGAVVEPPGPACSGEIQRGDPSSLVFDGVDDHVTMGTAPSLGLEKFTLEAWVKRDGAGVPFGTGVGGLSLVPIMGKGRGENDGTTADCNYAFGFAGDVLGADFEDSATGANHPVLGKKRIAIGEWHHVAATYDGTTWRLFVDGALDGEAAANAAPRAPNSVSRRLRRIWIRW